MHDATKNIYENVITEKLRDAMHRYEKVVTRRKNGGPIFLLHDHWPDRWLYGL